MVAGGLLANGSGTPLATSLSVNARDSPASESFLFKIVELINKHAMTGRVD